MDRVVIAGGTESLSTSPQSWKVLEPGGEPQMWMSPSHTETPDAPTFDMSITVGENTAREMGLTRLDVDEWAAYSHGQAIASIDSGAFEEEIVPVEYTDRDGKAQVFRVDEHPRRGTTVETLAELKPLHPEIEGATVTAGNAAGLNDAAAAVMLTAGDYAEAHGLRPLGRVGVVGLLGRRAGAHGHGADPRHPEGAGAGRADRRRHRPVRDQRGVLLGAGGGDPHPGPRPDDRERERQRMQPRSPHRRDRRPHGGHDGQRAAPAGQDPRRGVHVRGRRHGLGDGARGCCRDRRHRPHRQAHPRGGWLDGDRPEHRARRRRRRRRDHGGRSQRREVDGGRSAPREAEPGSPPTSPTPGGAASSSTRPSTPWAASTRSCSPPRCRRWPRSRRSTPRPGRT